MDALRDALIIGKRAKSAAKQYLTIHHISIPSSFNYASLRHESGEYWINPKVNLLDDDWCIVLNNNISRELIVLTIPANTLTIGKAYHQLLIRTDKPDMIDLNIIDKSFIDRRSNINFSPYITDRIEY